MLIWYIGRKSPVMFVNMSLIMPLNVAVIPLFPLLFPADMPLLFRSFPTTETGKTRALSRDWKNGERIRENQLLGRQSSHEASQWGACEGGRHPYTPPPSR